METASSTSQLPDWYSSGVPVGPTLCRVNPLHLEGLRGGNSAYHTSLGGQSVGRHPLVTHFLHSMRKLYALKWKCHFMVRRLPAQPSQLPDWYSSGVPAGPFLHRVNPLHLEGLRGGNSAFHTSLGGHSVGRHPLVIRFLQRLRPPAR